MAAGSPTKAADVTVANPRRRDSLLFCSAIRRRFVVSKPNTRTWWIAVPLGVVLSLVAACSSQTGTAHPIPPSPSPIASATSAPSTTPTPATSSVESGLKTYSEVVATYPGNVSMCDTVADLVPSGYEVTGGGVKMVNGKIRVPWYGIKITVKKRTTVDGKTYEVGTMLTVDAKMHLTPVSSWD
jgi:hypothetical protein